MAAAREVLYNDYEFVAAQPAQERVLIYKHTEPDGCLREDVVADIMAQAVVYAFKVVKIREEEGEAAWTAVDEVLYFPKELLPVRKVCQLIVVSKVAIWNSYFFISVMSDIVTAK